MLSSHTTDLVPPYLSPLLSLSRSVAAYLFVSPLLSTHSVHEQSFGVLHLTLHLLPNIYFSLSVGFPPIWKLKNRASHSEKGHKEKKKLEKIVMDRNVGVEISSVALASLFVIFICNYFARSQNGRRQWHSCHFSRGWAVVVDGDRCGRWRFTWFERSARQRETGGYRRSRCVRERREREREGGRERERENEKRRKRNRERKREGKRRRERGIKNKKRSRVAHKEETVWEKARCGDEVRRACEIGMRVHNIIMKARWQRKAGRHKLDRQASQQQRIKKGSMFVSDSTKQPAKSTSRADRRKNRFKKKATDQPATEGQDWKRLFYCSSFLGMIFYYGFSLSHLFPETKCSPWI